MSRLCTIGLLLAAVLCGAATTLAQSSGSAAGSLPVGQTFNCAAPQYANLNACLDAAKAYVGNGNGGADKAVGIYLPATTMSLAGPYTLVGGMQIIGQYPRIEYIAGTSADLNMIPNGGTWIDCGGNACFSGSGLRGVVLQDLGFKDWGSGALATFGGDNLDGIAFSVLRDLIGIGSTTLGATDAGFVLYNIQHVEGDHLNFFDVNSGLRLISQGPGTNGLCPANSVFKDVYTYTYAKSAATGNNGVSKAGLLIEALDHSGTASCALAYLKFIRPQVNSYNGDNTGYGIALIGTATVSPVTFNDIDSADVEGALGYGIYYGVGSSNNHSTIAGTALTGTPIAGVYNGGAFNFTDSKSNTLTVSDNDSNHQSAYSGTFASVAAGTRGFFYNGPSGGFQLNSDYAWLAQGMTFGNFASGQLAAEWDGSATTPIFTDSTGKDGIFFAHAANAVEIVGNNIEDAYFAPASMSTSGSIFAGALPSGGTQTATTLCEYTLSTFYAFGPCSSLRKYKKNIRTLGLALPEVMKLHPVSYTWKATGQKQIGFVAEEMEQIDPRNVEYDKGKLVGVQYDHMVALLTKAIQEQQKEIEDLQSRISRIQVQ